MPRPPVKKTEKLAFAAKMGELKAISKAHRGKKFLEESLREHIGKAVDRMDPVDGLLYGAVAYVGYDLTKDWKGALIGPIALKLATSPSEIAAVAGIAALGSLGLLYVGSLFPEAQAKMKPEIDKMSSEELEAFIKDPSLGSKIHPVTIFYAEHLLAEKKAAAAAEEQRQAAQPGRER